MNQTVKELGKKVVALLPTKPWLSWQFKKKFGRKINWGNPTTFNEKLQWLKVYDHNPIYTTMVDKYEAKKYVADIIGEEHIIPTLGVWDRFDDIDFDLLPDRFVLKCTHDSGGLVIVRDKAKFDKEAARKKFKIAMNRNPYDVTREWPYKDVKPHIIAEKYMENENGTSGLTDYKFFCFNGEPRMLYVSKGLENHETATISFYDMNGDPMPFHRRDYRPLEGKFTPPPTFDEMKKLAGILATKADCPFVRVDLYSIDGIIYFSEITFFPCSGMMPFSSEEWDLKLGEWINLQKKDEDKLEEGVPV